MVHGRRLAQQNLCRQPSQLTEVIHFMKFGILPRTTVISVTEEFLQRSCRLILPQQCSVAVYLLTAEHTMTGNICGSLIQYCLPLFFQSAQWSGPGVSMPYHGLLQKDCSYPIHNLPVRSRSAALLSGPDQA